MRPFGAELRGLVARIAVLTFGLGLVMWPLAVVVALLQLESP